MIVQCKEEDVEKNGYRHTHSLTDMPHNDPAQYTVLGWVKTCLKQQMTKKIAVKFDAKISFNVISLY